MNNLPEGKICLGCKNFKSLDSFWKQPKGKFGRRSRCKTCTKSVNDKWKINNPEKHKEINKEWIKNNPDKVSAKQKRYREKHPEIIKENIKNWKLNNPEKYLAGMAKYRAATRSAIPKWANLNIIEEIYKTAKELELLDGIKRHVDHIVPLQGENVCSLHVENNLQILTASENCSKGNSFKN